ncbi:HNH endonuclease [Paenibacillus sophorae]|nr:HNH endonuclease [Paenibacillus sophorae]
MFYSQTKKSKKRGKYIYYYPECKECSIRRSLKWQSDNHEYYLQQKHIYNTNQTKVSESWRKREREHSKEQRINGYQSEWRKVNPEKLKEYNRQRYSNKKHEITFSEWDSCKKYFNYMCAYCGITEEEHRLTLNQQLHREHVDCNGSNDLSNCVPACQSCNSSKHKFELIEWYDEDNTNFREDRLLKLIKWVTEDYKNFLEKANQI